MQKGEIFMQLLDAIYKDLQSIVSTIVIKYDAKAKAFDTVDNKRSSDLYMSAFQQKDTFNTYAKFDYQAIINAGITDFTTAMLYANDKTLIPRDTRDSIVIAQRNLIIGGYTEANNYYRMLNGMPNIEDYTFIYIDQATCTLLDINPTTPIHELPLEDIIRLESKGFLDIIRAANPTKSYLNFLGEKMISFVQARNSENFSILSMTKDIPENFNEEFHTIYDQCREYFLSTVYNKNYGKQYDLYDNFISLMVMVMTIQRLISNTFKYGIEYDFYDLGSIKMIFDAYNVPFIQNVPVEYQRILIRNINNLLRYKSTDKVIYDICSLLGLDTVKIFKYYLFKEHRFDTLGNPVFAYKMVDDGTGTGNTIQIEDGDIMYNLFFQSIDIKERNLALALSNTTNVLDYDQVTVDDPYWWSEDAELKQAIYDGEFNFMESKYLSMNIMYKLTKMLFEVSYVFNMLIDKKSELTNITVLLPKLFDNKAVNLFDLTALLSALIAKKSGMAGNIIHSPSQILTIKGFNFQADFATIKANVAKDPNIDGSTILKYLQNLTVNVPADVNRLYGNIRDLNDFLINKIASSQNLDAYRAYKKLYDTLMITQHMGSLFTKSDGTVAVTFLEYLRDKDIVLAQYVDDIAIDAIGDSINHILVRLNLLVIDLKYLNIINESNTVLLNAAVTLIRFFKSYTTDLTGFNILYVLESRYFNMIKMIGKSKLITKELLKKDTSLNVNYKDIISTMSKQILNKTSLQIQDTITLQWQE